MFPLIISATVLLALAIAYTLRPADLSALTIFPAWAMLPLPWLIALGWIRRVDRRGLLALALLSLAYVFEFSEEWISLKRSPSLQMKQSNSLRIIELNCAGGNPEAADEVAKYYPDIILFAESPGKADMQRLADRMWAGKGHVVSGPDGSIVTRGQVREVQVPRGTSDFVLAQVDIDGHKLNIVSLRLTPPAFRLDLIVPSAWTEVANNAITRRIELAAVVSFLERQPRILTVVGGDFNSQPGSYGLSAMLPWLTDAFYRAGSGWCHTAVNDYPLARIDQIWTSKDVLPLQLVVMKTVNSDHRMVICDVELATP